MSIDKHIPVIQPVAHEPNIVHECWNVSLFYLDERCLCTTFYSCRYQEKANSPAMVSGRPCYVCVKHKPKPVQDIVDWINRYGKKPESEGDTHCHTGEDK